LELLKNRLKDLTFKFQKFLKNQSEVIRNVEQRRSNLTSSKVQKMKTNEFYSAVPSNDEDEVIDVNMTISQTQITHGNKNQYYQDRTSAVQSIEKTMNELASMFTRLSHIVYEQRSMIET
jgi:t-SNARE complex subunit (syntaxin)